ncbi:MAG: class I SAM-dependent methyltransferase [Trichlorobacter sp.]|uniref:class I SAM-dependent methyltransferase n=1 Tax=Trichlorobacter sp. TaxID=2911007 RepID=UPI002560481E|nr:class I SAM-dependent methyltransferase [Trichlorobacter sp.]MDK9719228.1 class I SAM-dependent methyltransferase [Trichlorobacter sp.]
MLCSVCDSATVLFGEATVLARHQAVFLRCPKCGTLALENPHWLSEAYSQAITSSDLGLVARNLELSRIVKVLIRLLFNPAGRFLDYAGGYGLLVRLMRDAGFDFYWHDPYCTNLFASQFRQSTAGDERFELVTAFEMLEHLELPVQAFDRMFSFSDNMLCTTLLLPEPAPKPQEWWYYGLEHGQHITFYTRRSLELIAERFGRRFYTNGSGMHLFSTQQHSQLLFGLLARHKVARLLAPWLGRPSLLQADFTRATGLTLDRRNS